MPGRHFPPASCPGRERNTGPYLGPSLICTIGFNAPNKPLPFTDEKTEAWRSQGIVLLSLNEWPCWVSNQLSVAPKPKPEPGPNHCSHGSSKPGCLWVPRQQLSGVPLLLSQVLSIRERKEVREGQAEGIHSRKEPRVAERKEATICHTPPKTGRWLFNHESCLVQNDMQRNTAGRKTF